MGTVEKSLCIFIHFCNDIKTPEYVRMFVNELSEHFDQVIIATNQRSHNTDFNVFSKTIEVRQFQNEGYDLGLFYKVFQTINPEEYHQIACINDSNILFNKLTPIFNWSQGSDHDFWGVIDSYEKPWFSTHTDNYHIQSHFIVFNRKSIELLHTFFGLMNIDRIFSIKDSKKLRQTVINEWEIGLSQYLIKNGLKHGSFVDSQRISELYFSGKKNNVTHKLYPELIRSGYPFIKKKIISNGRWIESFRFYTHWEKMILIHGNKNWNLLGLIDEMILFENNETNQKIRRLTAKINLTYNQLFKKKIA
ncbi:MAG: hypothetical protein WAO52_11140 [Prolixibacteraceae bacterium]